MGQWRGCEEVVRGAKAKLQNRESRRQSFFFFFAFVFDLGFSVFKKYLFIDPKLIYYTDESVKDYLLLSKINLGASLVVHWLRICLPVQGTWVQFLVQEDPTCVRQLSPWATTTEPARHRACALQEEKPSQWEAWTLKLESSPPLPQLEKAQEQRQRPTTAKTKQTHL